MAFDPSLFNDFDNIEESAQDSALVSGGQTGYPRPLWLSGFGITHVDAPRGTGAPRGFYYSVDRIPDSMKQAFEKLVQKGEAQLLKVRHGEGNVKEYYRFKNAERYYALAHGVPAKSAVLTKPEFQTGLAMGSRAKIIERDKKRQVNQGSYTSILVVSQSLYEAGYVDEYGRPGLINLYMDGLNSVDFLNLLDRHLKFLRSTEGKLRKIQADGDPEGIAKKWLSKIKFWAFAMELLPTEEQVLHKGNPNPVYALDSLLSPKQEEWSFKTLENLYCGDDLYKVLRTFMYDVVSDSTGNRSLVPGGEAAEWCRNVVADALKNQQEWTDPSGKVIPYGTQDVPVWYERKMQLQNLGVDEAVNTGVSEKKVSLSVDDLRNEINLCKRKAKSERNEEQLGKLKTAEELLNGETDDDVIKEVATILEEVAKEQAESVPF